MDKMLHLTLLYDFYGELLTEKQKKVFELYYSDDLSMQEIAEQFDISRQSINDLLKRTEKLLIDYEQRLLLLANHITVKSKIDSIVNVISDYEHKDKIDKNDLENIREMLINVYD